MPGGIEKRNRDLLERLHRAMEGPFTAADAASRLEINVSRSRRLLAYLASRGWLARVRRGLYTLVPLGASSPSEWREDPWLVAAKAFAPCYIGGWSACEYWALTEQLFRDVVVVTARPIRRTRVEVQGTPFHLTSLPKGEHFGLRTVWRGRVRVSVSDPSRTVVDLLDAPALGGGIRHVAGVLAAYVGSEHRDDVRLIEYARRRGNRTIFKRLGYLLEALRINEAKLIESCRERTSAGLTLLDPSVRSKGRIVKRWNLRVNVRLSPAESTA